MDIQKGNYVYVDQLEKAGWSLLYTIGSTNSSLQVYQKKMELLYYDKVKSLILDIVTGHIQMFI